MAWNDLAQIRQKSWWKLAVSAWGRSPCTHPWAMDSLEPGTWNRALCADSGDSVALQKKEKKMLTDMGHSSTLQWKHIMVGQHQHRKCFPNLLKLGTFYLSNARRKLCTASEANTPSAWSFPCSAQMQWGTAAGTFVLWLREGGRDSHPAEREQFPAHCILQRPHQQGCTLKTDLSKHCTFLRTPTALPSTKCHWYLSHPRALLPRPQQADLKALNIKILRIFFLTQHHISNPSACSTALHLSHYFRPPTARHSLFWCAGIVSRNTNSLEQFSRSKDLHLPNPSFGENSLILQFWEHRNSTTQVQNVLLVLWAGEGREGSGSENPQPAQGVTYCQRAVPHVRGYETLDCAILCIPGIEPLHVVLLYPPYDQHCYCRKNDQHYHRSQDNDD